MGHPIAFEFAARLAEIAPAGLDRIFFTSSGSESVETALKIAIVYQRAIGQGTRTRLIGRERGYHGVGFGGLSDGGILNTAGSIRWCQEQIISVTRMILIETRFQRDSRSTVLSWQTISSVLSHCMEQRPLPL
ncbi:adenosylmethionine-8-amino-7-oxononanoate aminotransferase [Rhizobium laguerreae]